jgi:pimeloyl-ACP methyl ester carboxylesterase
VARRRAHRLTATVPDPTFVLVHGGAHGAWCWSPLLPHLAGPALAVDLPPKSVRGVRGEHTTPPPELLTVGVDDFASSVIADVDEAGIDRFVLVGHSMGGLTIPEVARRIPERVAHLVFVSCLVPPEGGSTIDALPEAFRDGVRRSVDDAIAGRADSPMGQFNDELTRHMFCNDMDEEQTAFVLAHTGLEAPRAFADPVTRVGIPPDLPKTYVRLAQDQALAPEDQERAIAALRGSPGGALSVVDLDTGHDVMISAPETLAPVLNELAVPDVPATEAGS